MRGDHKCEARFTDTNNTLGMSSWENPISLSFWWFLEPITRWWGDAVLPAAHWWPTVALSSQTCIEDRCGLQEAPACYKPKSLASTNEEEHWAYSLNRHASCFLNARILFCEHICCRHQTSCQKLWKEVHALHNILNNLKHINVPLLQTSQTNPETRLFKQSISYLGLALGHRIKSCRGCPF